MKRFIFAAAAAVLGAGVFFGSQVVFAQGMAKDTIAEGVFINERIPL